MFVFIFLCGFVTTYAGKAMDIKQRTEKCAALACNAGQECILDKSGNVQFKCQCKSSCPDNRKPVCGSDGITYPNHCELHRTACVDDKRIGIKHKGPCQQEILLSSNNKVQKSKPVVCYERNRNEMRDRLINWMLIMARLLGINSHEVFLNFYNGMDTNKNNKLDREEFLKLVKSDEMVAKIPGEDEYINPVLQPLCSDALLNLMDLDADRQLTFYEFKHSLDPHFKPPHKLCEFEGHMYKDGAEIPTDCNSCVCACGNWVCTALDCSEDGSHDNEEENVLVLDGNEAKKKLKKEIAKQEVRVNEKNP